jgi:transposase
MGRHKLRTAERTQVEMHVAALDDLIARDHRVRLVWSFVEVLDISVLLGRLRSFEGATGAPATDPRILLALWLFATLDGVGSARQIDRLCERDLAYKWIAGGVSVNHHTLADFRSNAGSFLDDVLTRSVAALVAAKVVDLSCIAVDGLRVRASAGSSSFRKRERLMELEGLARARIEALKAAPEDEPARRRAAQERAARERAERLAEALAAVDEIEAARVAEDEAKRCKTPKTRLPARGSTTDPQARVMRMAAGGFAPAYNLQVKTDPKAGAVVGVEVSAGASDRGKLGPAVAEIERRHGRRPNMLLADDGYDGRDDIEAVEKDGTAVHVPLPKDPARQAARPKDGEGVKAWKARMMTDAGKAAYGLRINTEHAHAHMRNHGLHQMPVRGLTKVTAVALLFAVATNLLLHGPAMIAAMNASATA